MNPEIYLSVAQAADLLGISQETLYKEIQSKNLTAIESPDKKRKHQVIAHSELSRRYGNIYIPDGYLEYAGDKSVDFVRIALRQENQRLRKALEETQSREQKPQRAAQNRPPKPQIAHRDPRRPHQNHRQPNRSAGQNDINSSNAGEVSNLAIVKLSITLYIPVIFTKYLKIIKTHSSVGASCARDLLFCRSEFHSRSSVGGNSNSRLLLIADC